MLVASICSVLNKLFDLMPPLLIGAAVDIVVSREGSFVSRIGLSDVELQLWALAGLTILVWGLESLFEYALDCRWRMLAQTIQHALRMDVYHHVRALEGEHFGDKGIGGVVCIVNDDVNQLERFLDGSANQLIQMVTTISFVGIMFLTLAPSVAWMTFLPMPVVIWASLRFQKRLGPHYADVRGRAGRLASELSISLGRGPSTVGSSALHAVSPVETISLEYVQANRIAIRFSAAFVPVLRMVIVMGFVAMLIYGGKLALAGKLELGVYSVMVFMTQSLLWPLAGLGELMDRYRRAMASTVRVFALLDLDPHVEATAAA